MWWPGKKKIARCACCGSEVEQYLPLSDYFLDKFAQYRHPWQSFEMCNAPQYACPVCGAEASQIRGGLELELDYIEVNEDEPTHLPEP